MSILTTSHHIHPYQVHGQNDLIFIHNFMGSFSHSVNILVRFLIDGRIWKIYMEFTFPKFIITQNFTKILIYAPQI